ncbi:MAG: ATP-dependent DNA helicase [Tyzzerella sp.]|nr:ATP-dependent DNA helicase [Tyzzerella sp.]
MKDLKVIRISVRNLVEFLLSEGDIDSRITSSSDKDAMQMGSKIHRKIQRQMGSNYRAEVSLKIQIPYEKFILQLEGRADGIQEDEDGVLIDEIKGVQMDLEHVKEPVGVHLAQAKCYAYIYGKQQSLKEVAVQMTYCQMGTMAVKHFLTKYSMNELEEWFYGVVNQYERWANFQIDWEKVRTESIKSVEFPYEYRKGQKELVTSVYRTILRKKKLFIQAPTGVGKTMATLFPAVKAMGEGLGDKLFYLTAKTITRTVAEQAFLHLKKKGLKMKTITLIAKEKICFCEQTECNPEVCPYAKGHFDRVNDAVYDLLTATDDMSRELIKEYAEKHQVCPFEMALDVSLWVDGVICDYNYVFDPNAHLKRFFSEGKKGNYLFLIDEAHNLVERGREMYSATLIKEDFLSVKKKVKEYPKLVHQLDACNKILLELKRECETYVVHANLSHFYIKLVNVYNQLEKVLEENRHVDDEVIEFYFNVRFFLSIYEEIDDNYVIYTEMAENGEFKVKLYCVNPATKLDEYLQYGNSTIFFSATLLPIAYYKKLLSVETDDYAIYAESSFSTENRLLLVGNDVSTRYTQRGKTMYQKYASYIANIVKARKGNYLAFFPSYIFMEQVREAFEELDISAVRCIYQAQNMKEQDREEFLEMFEEEQEESLVGFCVLGGVFSEGIDLTAERLIGAIIVGTGLPQVCNERELLKQYFDRQNENGFDYAYLYPGMNKVLQAAGRVIRTEQDVGVIALLDERFRKIEYQRTFPREWQDICDGNAEMIGKRIQEFWKK